MSDFDKLRSIRLDILLQSTSVDSPGVLLDIQEAIADEIIAAELTLNDEQNEEAKNHIRRLRIYADGLAFQVLHPHVVRQLAKNSDVAISLSGQKDAFNVVRLSARRHVNTLGVPVLISDITNVLKIGDLIVVTDDEKPLIVEVKSKLPAPQHLMQGRVGRQVSRSMSTQEYLREGTATLFGQDMLLTVSESDFRPERNWDAVTEVSQRALADGYASLELSEYEMLWAYPKGPPDRMISEIKSRHTGEHLTFAGTSRGLMNMTDGIFYPPSVWPILPGLRFAIVEEDIEILHIVDMAAFERGNSVERSIEYRPSESHPVIVRTPQREYPL